MTQPAKSQEPSMEEILASIRRIHADKDPTKATTKDTTGREAAAAPPETAPRPMTPPPPRITPAAAAAPAPPKTDEEIDSMLAHLRGTSRQPPGASAQPGVSEAIAAGEPQRPAIEEHGLLSAATTAAVDAAFDSLARTAQARNGRTVEELVSELLRPMLKAWLD